MEQAACNTSTSQTKCDGGASQLASLPWPKTNLHAIRQYCQIKLFTLYFVHCNLLMHEALATVPAA